MIVHQKVHIIFVLCVLYYGWGYNLATVHVGAGARQASRKFLLEAAAATMVRAVELVGCHSEPSLDQQP